MRTPARTLIGCRLKFSLLRRLHGALPALGAFGNAAEQSKADEKGLPF